MKYTGFLFVFMMCIFWDCHLACLLGQVADGLSEILFPTETNDWMVFTSNVSISKERKQNRKLCLKGAS